MTDQTNVDRNSGSPNCSSLRMDDQQVFELGQLYSDLFLIRRLIDEGAGIRQRLLSQSDCEYIERISVFANQAIGGVMRRIDSHKIRKM